MQWLNVGKIVNTHGVRGEVRVMSHTDFPEQRYAKGNDLGLFMPKSKEPIMLVVQSRRQHKNFDLLTFEDHPSINDVEKYRDGMLKILADQLDEAEELLEHEFYYHEIIGCLVSTLDNQEVGKVVEILETGANDVWGIKAASGKMHYIPYIEDVVKDVNVADKKIVIDPLEGLLS